ncbi:hypothetical protein Clacol_009939 [Clathrus columnatus]|uniref:DUF7514 domain-containing protein n=1 Tax=Clathrus columnatus TaxID=1419009 RepID=A0AAV5ALY7_9AGAM|nr:hypothetical protein Clacol_009939 [Clathrus columnatus]
MSSTHYDDEDEQLPSYESCIAEFSEDNIDSPVTLVEDPPTSSTGHATPPVVPIDSKPSRSFPPTASVSEPATPPPPIPIGTRPRQYDDNNNLRGTLGGPSYSGQEASPTEGQYPSNTLCRLADALFHRLTTTDCIDPLGLVRAADPVVQRVELTPQMLFRFKRFLNLAGIPFTLAKSGLPVLSRDSFIQWIVFEARANPDYSYATWQTRLRYYSLYDPQTRIPFASIPRMAFPERATEAVLTNVHDVWRAIVDVLGKRQRENYKKLPRVPQRSQLEGISSGGNNGTSSYIEEVVKASECRIARRLGKGVGKGIVKGALRGVF